GARDRALPAGQVRRGRADPERIDRPPAAARERRRGRRPLRPAREHRAAARRAGAGQPGARRRRPRGGARRRARPSDRPHAARADADRGREAERGAAPSRAGGEVRPGRQGGAPPVPPLPVAPRPPRRGEAPLRDLAPAQPPDRQQLGDERARPEGEARDPREAARVQPDRLAAAARPDRGAARARRGRGGPQGERRAPRGTAGVAARAAAQGRGAEGEGGRGRSGARRRRRRMRRAALVAGVLAACAAAGAAHAQQPPPRPATGAPATVVEPEHPAFLERTDSGLDFVHHRFTTPSKKYLPEITGSGIGLLDYDGDGLLDVYCAQCCPLPGYPEKVEAPPDALYRNLGRVGGHFRFERVADRVTVKSADGTPHEAPLGLGDRAYSMSV